jgi:hypothetical protein
MWNLHAKFSSEESLRYGAECGRLGRVARKSMSAARQKAPAKLQAPKGNWLGHLFSAPRLPAKLAHR